MFRTGDRVKFLNDVGGGIVTRVDKRYVYVENEDGFEVPSAASQLLRAEFSPEASSKIDFAGEKLSADETQEATATTAPIDYIDLTDEPDEPDFDISVNVLLAVVQSKNSGQTEYDIYLVNDCTYNIMYVAAMTKDAAYRGIQAGTLENNATIHLTTIAGEDLKSISSLHFDILFYKKGNYLPHEPMRYKLEIDEFYLTDPVNHVKNVYFDEKALFFNISEEHLMNEIENFASELEEQKKQVDEPVEIPQKKVKTSDMEEVDLHIEELVENPKSLNPTQMLDIQMGRFTISLEGAINSDTKRIVFIHGVGNGRLRLEIQRTLDKKYPNLRYQDASFKEYGFGATLVFV